jgi:hypothetical protein
MESSSRSVKSSQAKRVDMPEVRVFSLGLGDCEIRFANLDPRIRFDDNYLAETIEVPRVALRKVIKACIKKGLLLPEPEIAKGNKKTFWLTLDEMMFVLARFPGVTSNMVGTIDTLYWLVRDAHLSHPAYHPPVYSLVESPTTETAATALNSFTGHLPSAQNPGQLSHLN